MVIISDIPEVRTITKKPFGTGTVATDIADIVMSVHLRTAPILVTILTVPVEDNVDIITNTVVIIDTTIITGDVLEVRKPG